jgi:hypothetical protein
MAAGILQQDRRTARAAGIVERHEAHLRDDGTWQVRDTQGSGRWYVVMDGHCSCPDYVYRNATCKHLRAVMQEERALAQYGQAWDARSEQQRQAATANFAVQNITPKFGVSPTCPDCGSRLESQSYYIGGRGYQAFMVCTRDAQHRALPA